MNMFIFQKTVKKVFNKSCHKCKRFLVLMMPLATRSMAVFLPGKRSMAFTIFSSAIHLSRMFLALE